MINFVDKVIKSKGTSLFYIGQAGFIIKNKSGKLLGIDLYLSDCVERYEGHIGFKRLLPKILNYDSLEFDILISTHAHYDHFDIDAIPYILHENTKLFCSENCKKFVDKMDLTTMNNIVYVKPNDFYSIDGFDISFVKCDHGSSAPDAFGVVIDVDGKIIYEVGDSSLRLDYINDLPDNIDVLIGPINGMYGNMDSKELSELASYIKPDITIPCHYGMFASHGGDLNEFVTFMNEKKLKFYLMQYGECLNL